MYIEEVTNAAGTAAGFVADWSIKPIALPKAKIDCFDTAYTGGYVMHFDNATTGKADKYYWDYNYDGIPDDSAKDGTYLFTSTGTYNIQLTAFNCSGSSRALKNIRVIDPVKKPQTNFAADRLSGDTPINGDLILQQLLISIILILHRQNHWLNLKVRESTMLPLLHQMLLVLIP